MRRKRRATYETKFDLKMHWVTLPSGKRKYVPVGVTAKDLLKDEVNPNGRYTKAKEEAILALYLEGCSLLSISKKPGFPSYATMSDWKVKHPSFRLGLEQLRKFRGQHFEEKAVELAEEAKEYNVASSKLKVDTYKWAAEVSDPEVYGKKTKLIGDPNAPVSFIIDTGISRASDQKEAPPIEIKQEGSGEGS